MSRLEHSATTSQHNVTGTCRSWWCCSNIHSDSLQSLIHTAVGFPVLLPSFPFCSKTWLALAGLHVLSQGILTCRLYQTDYKVSALATDNRPFIFIKHLFQILTPTCSRQQSEYTQRWSFSFSPSQHLTLSSARAQLNNSPSLTYSPYVVFVTPTLEKTICKTYSIRFWWNCTKWTKVNASCRNNYKGSLQDVSWICFHHSRKL
jgi:hypothetical protein